MASMPIEEVTIRAPRVTTCTFCGAPADGGVLVPKEWQARMMATDKDDGDLRIGRTWFRIDSLVCRGCRF